MVAVFQTLGQLGNHLEQRGNVEVVDPGMSLTEWTSQLSQGHNWGNQPSVRKVVGFAARNIASVPLHLYERRSEQDRARVRDGALAQLLRKPSRAPGMTPYRFWENLLIDGLIHDKYCAAIVEHDDGHELVRIPAGRVRFTGDSLGRIDEVVITNRDGKSVGQDPAGFLLDVGYSERGVNGTSPLQTLKDLLDESREAVGYRRSIWKNGARVPGIIKREKPWSSTEARDRFSTSWKSFTRDGGKEGGTPVLEDGMDYKEVNAFRPRDTLDLEGRRLTDIEVAAAYHIAPELVGAREGTFANITAFKQMLYGPALGPYIVGWEQALNTTLVPKLQPNGDHYIEANIEAKLRGSFEEQSEVMSKSIGAPWMTRNEGRARMNMSALDGGDELITPLNVLVGGQASPQDGGDGK
jgi:HK97 family phage portal protein